MSSKSNQAEPDSHTIGPSAAYSEQWWQAAGYDPSRLSDAVGDSSKHALLGNPVDTAQSIDDQSETKAEDDDDEASMDSAATGSTSTHQDGSTGLEGQKSQCAESTMPFVSGIGLPQHPQLDLFGHPVGCATAPYPDLYYGGMVAPYGPHPMLYGMHQPRMPLPLEMAQEPVYVNAKQYHGILRRRQVRAKAELERKLIKERKPYLHESRHQHALRRARSTGGRFAKKSGEQSSNHSGEDNKTSGESHSSKPHKNRKDKANNSADSRAMEGQSSQQWGSSGNMSSDQATQHALAMR
ncbi:nuclear transcription factor Y subunit A-9-like isoform X2 [Silene latifolia]|uniref:nuclear transcription factor Y subunit A-9-like isoform X2 n=1 Tax=Silene latifolia TaxID=37657 RepID=UPI003D76E57A